MWKWGATPKELVWSCDKIKMYHYTRETPAKCATPVLVSFAMLNRHDVLDLQPDRSLMKKLLDEGLDIYIMDWGYHNRSDRYITMEDYIDVYMNGAVDFIRERHNVDKIHKMGICQGGTFSMIYAALYPEKLKSLTTYVAPYDFDNTKCMLYTWTKYIDVDTMSGLTGHYTGRNDRQLFRYAEAKYGRKQVPGGYGFTGRQQQDDELPADGKMEERPAGHTR